MAVSTAVTLRRQTVSTNVGRPVIIGDAWHKSRIAASNVVIAPDLQYVQTAGYSSPGDGGGALNTVSVSDPMPGYTGAGKFQLADGRYALNVDRGVNPLALGCKPDGATDCTDELQDALDFAAAREHDIVVLPYGRFLISGDGITVPPGVAMRGAGMAQTRLIYDGAGTAITWEGTRGLASGEAFPHVGSYLQDFSLWQKTGSKVGVGIWWKHSTRSHLMRVGVKNFERGIDTSGASWSSSIQQCWIVQNSIGIYVGGTDDDFRKADDPNFTSLSRSGFNGGLIQTNEVQGNDVGIYMPYFSAVGASSFIAHGLTIRSNIIEDQRKNAIVWSQHQGGLRVENNYFELNCQAATIDVASATLALSDDVREYNAVICQDLPTTNRQMTKPVFRGNHFTAHAPGTWAFYHDRGTSPVEIVYDCNDGALNGICIRQRNTDFSGYGAVLNNNKFNDYKIDASQLQYVTARDNNLAGDLIGGDQTAVFRGLRVRGPIGDEYTAIATDADVTLTPGSTGGNVRHTGTLTADRTITLATTGAILGMRFRITRTGSGAFNLNIGTGPLKALTTGTWCEVVYDGSAWYLAAYGVL